MTPLLRSMMFVTTLAWSLSAFASEVEAGPPTALSLTVYRAASRAAGALALNRLDGFALISETRTVSIPQGDSRLRFEGVADGIEPATALISGLPAKLLEKDRDALLLSPSALVAATLGESVVLVRTDPKSGQSTRSTGVIRSDAGGGVVFQSDAGLEALRCSGLPETFRFNSRAQLSSSPVLSTFVRSPKAVTASVTLSYLARGFDWAANYVASISPDGSRMDIGAWVTLANSNGSSFDDARAQVVAGRLNRVSGVVEPLSIGGPILAQCWPRGTTSDIVSPEPYVLMEASGTTAAPAAAITLAATRNRLAMLVEEEQLGDLKLYRVPDRTTVASRQMKQVRLLDRVSVPVQIRYVADIAANQTLAALNGRRTLQTRNDDAHHLGVPLPSGQIASFETRGADELLLSESPLRDTAVGEDLEIDLGASPDVTFGETPERSRNLPPLPGIEHPRWAQLDEVNRIDIRNGRDAAIQVEVRLRLSDTAQLIAADHPVEWRNDRPLFALSVDAGSTVSIRFQTEHTNPGSMPR